jgi:Xaa-Pro dipeptidase
MLKTGQAYPTFSDAEMARRRAVVDDLAAEHDLAGVVVYGGRGSTAVPWLTGWHVTREAAAIVVPGQETALLVQLYNHVPNARRLAPSATVSWAGPRTVDTVVDALSARLPRRPRIGWIGPLSRGAADALDAVASAVVDLSGAYDLFRTVKSAEELTWMRRGAELTDRSFAAMTMAAKPGATELDLAAAVEGSYLADGGTNHIHFFATTPMAGPEVCVPSQWPSSRVLEPGDVLVTELSTSFWGYPGQILRTATIAAEPSPLHRELHEVATAAFDAIAARVRAGAQAADLVEAGDLIEAAGFTIYDDLVHGFGGGYLPPVLRTRATSHEPIPDLRLEAGMTIVVQPNVVTPDERAGVQTGELLLVTESGWERLHEAPRGLQVLL